MLLLILFKSLILKDIPKIFNFNILYVLNK